MTENESQRHTEDEASERTAAQKLVVAQTATGYWVVKRGDVAMAGAMTERAAQRERERMVRLAGRSVRRTLARA